MASTISPRRAEEAGLAPTSSVSPPLAVTMGDPAGIGPDLILAAWSRRHALALPPFLVIADPDLLTQRAAALHLDIPTRIADAGMAAATFAEALPVAPVRLGSAVRAGDPDPAHAGAIVAAIETAVALTGSGETAAVVTAPIAKSVLYRAGFGFPGHTEFLADLAARTAGRSVRPVMMLAGPRLKSVPVTIHIPFKDVPAALTRDLIVETGRIVATDLVGRFAIPHPRLAVAGLNPHAGENGALGLEDRDIIAPAVAELAAEGLDIVGPLPADTMFHEAARATFDAAICMYHDQALIPAKALGFDDAVNVTLGLPFIRTSPDHGTAFSIAASGTARPDSFIAALRMAADLAVNQRADAA